MRRVQGSNPSGITLQGSHQSGAFVAGVDSYGLAAIPREVQDAIVGQAYKEFMDAFKASWAMQQSGGGIGYYYWRALAVTSTEEGDRLAHDVGYQVVGDWAVMVIPELIAEVAVAKNTEVIMKDPVKLVGGEVKVLDIVPAAPEASLNSMRTTQSVGPGFDANVPSTFEGAAAGDVIKYFQRLGWEQKVAAKGEGAVKFVKPGTKGSIQYIIQPKGFNWGGDIHEGAYLKASLGKGTPTRWKLKRD